MHGITPNCSTATPEKTLLLPVRKATNGTLEELMPKREKKAKTLKFDFLPEGTKYKLTLIADGEHDKEFSTQYLVVDKYFVS